MRDPEGNEIPNRGVFLEVVPNEKLVITDACTRAWEPSDKPFMTAALTCENLGGDRTRHTARALHWTIAARETHEKMGFHQGWDTATDQLTALASSRCSHARAAVQRRFTERSEAPMTAATSSISSPAK